MSGKIFLGKTGHEAARILRDLRGGLPRKEAALLRMSTSQQRYSFKLAKRKAPSKLLKMLTFIRAYCAKNKQPIEIRKLAWNGKITTYKGPSKSKHVHPKLRAQARQEVVEIKNVKGYTLVTLAWAKKELRLYNTKLYRLAVPPGKIDMSFMVYNTLNKIQVFYAQEPSNTARSTRQTLWHELGHVSLLFQGQPDPDPWPWPGGPGPIPGQSIARKKQDVGKVINSTVNPIVR